MGFAARAAHKHGALYVIRHIHTTVRTANRSAARLAQNGLKVSSTIDSD